MADPPDHPEPRRGPSAPGPVSPPPHGEPSPPATTRSARRHRVRRRRVVLAIGAVVIVAIVAGGVVALTGGSSTTKRAVHHVAAGTTTTTTTSAPSSAPTTIVPRSSNPVVALAQQYDGSYQGTFTNTTFHTTGTASLDLRIDPAAATLTATVGLNGDLFGGGAKAVRQINGTVALGNPAAAVTAQTPSFGPVTAKLGAGLSIVLTASNVPDPKVQTFQLTGLLRTDKRGFDATFQVGFRNGQTAQGTVTVLCAATGQRPSQVTTLCAS